MDADDLAIGIEGENASALSIEEKIDGWIGEFTFEGLGGEEGEGFVGVLASEDDRFGLNDNIGGGAGGDGDADLTADRGLGEKQEEQQNLTSE